jgi:hypothetical protein
MIKKAYNGKSVVLRVLILFSVLRKRKLFVGRSSSSFTHPSSTRGIPPHTYPAPLCSRREVTSACAGLPFIDKSWWGGFFFFFWLVLQSSSRSYPGHKTDTKGGYEGVSRSLLVFIAVASSILHPWLLMCCPAMYDVKKVGSRCSCCCLDVRS